MISKILSLFAVIASFVAAIFGFKFYKQKTENLQKEVSITRHNKDVLNQAEKAAAPTDYVKIEDYKDEINDAYDNNNFADPFNPILPDEK